MNLQELSKNRNIQNIASLQQKINKIRSGKFAAQRVEKPKELLDLTVKGVKMQLFMRKAKPKISTKYPGIYRENIGKIKTRQIIENETVAKIYKNQVSINNKDRNLLNKRQRFVMNIINIDQEVSFAERVAKNYDAKQTGCFGKKYEMTFGYYR